MRTSIKNSPLRCSPGAARGFTLVELMLSITLFLVLMVGINYVFRTTSDAVGAGQTLNQFSRDSQTAQSILFDDFNNINKDPPCFIIASQLVTQYLNSDDAQTSPGPASIMADITDSSSTGSILSIGTGLNEISPALISYRNSRVDMVKFFAHGLYTRHSANEGSFTSPTTSQDAFITIGHAMLPTYDGQAFLGPVTDSTGGTTGLNAHLVQSDGSSASVLWPVVNDATGPQAVQRVGSYSSDWVLARSAVLLKDVDADPSNSSFEDGYPRYPNSIDGTAIGFPNVDGTAEPNAPLVIPYGANATPLGFFTPDSNFGTAAPRVGALITPFQSSRYDLALTTPDEFRRTIADEILQWESDTTPSTSLPNRHLWWNPLVYDLPLGQTGVTTYVPVAATATTPAYSYYTGNPAYYLSLNGTTGTYVAPGGTSVPPPDLARMAANPLLQTPLTSTAVAQMAPYFIQHCSQFIVEYAGDYLTQDNGGNITGIGGDGTIDYYVDPATGQHKIRWYGMPRDVDGDGRIFSVKTGSTIPINTTAELNPTPPTPPSPTDTPDVIPLRDYYAALLNSPTAAPPWEVDVNFDTPNNVTNDYADQPAANASGMNNSFGNAANPPRYTCAWYNDMPAMVRILIKVDDPNNKVKDGPWYEYVFKLK